MPPRRTKDHGAAGPSVSVVEGLQQLTLSAEYEQDLTDTGRRALTVRMCREIPSRCFTQRGYSELDDSSLIHMAGGGE